MGNNVIKYGPATLARLVAELEEPITSAITNPAPIEHGLVMRRRGSNATDHAEDYTVGDALGLRRSDEPDTFAGPIIARSMRTLARNLRDAAGCALAWRLHRDFEWDWQHGDCEAWCPNLDGARADEWQRLAETEAREHLATAKQLIEAQAERDAARAEALHLRQALNERNVL